VLRVQHVDLDQLPSKKLDGIPAKHLLFNK